MLLSARKDTDIFKKNQDFFLIFSRNQYFERTESY